MTRRATPVFLSPHVSHCLGHCGRGLPLDLPAPRRLQRSGRAVIDPGLARPGDFAGADAQASARQRAPTLRVVPLSVTKHAADCAAIHRTSLSGGFMVSLGLGFLRCVIANVATSPAGIALVAEVDERVVGFALATTSPRSLYRDFLRRYAVQAMFHALPRLLRPSSVIRAYETWRYPSRAASVSRPEAELLDLAVQESDRQRGAATALFEALVHAFRERGVQSFAITTGEPLHAAHRFYERMGARRVGAIEVHRSAVTFVYVYG